MSMREKAERDNLREEFSPYRSDQWIYLKTDEIRDLLTLADERDALQAEIERYRNAVPEDVQLAMDIFHALSIDYGACAIDEAAEALGKAVKAKTHLKTLIGSLIEKSREKVEAAFYAGTSWQVESNDMNCETSWKEAKAYAEKITGGGDE